MSDCNCRGDPLFLGSNTETVTVEKEVPVLVDDYSELRNKPSIEGVTLDGNRTFEELGLYEAVYSKEAVDETVGAANEKVQSAVESVASLSQEIQSVTEKEEISNVDLDSLLTLD